MDLTKIKILNLFFKTNDNKFEKEQYHFIRKNHSFIFETVSKMINLEKFELDSSFKIEYKIFLIIYI